jgi:hypothetical protein
MRRILWIAVSALVAVVLVTYAFQTNTNTRGKSPAGTYQPQSSGDTSRYQDLRLR